MLAYIIRRLLYFIPTILGVALLVFVLFTFAGEDPVRMKLGPHATPESIAELRRLWGLDQPYWAQFLDFLKQIVTFDYGRSYDHGERLSELFTAGAKVSLSLTLPPYLIGLCVNVSLAMLIAYKRGSWFDRFATGGAVMAMSISYLVYIISFQYLLAYELDLFPINGYESGWRAVPYLVLPGLIFLFVSIGPDIRIYRTFFLDEMNADYVRTARAKGVSETGVLFKHVLQNFHAFV